MVTDKSIGYLLRPVKYYFSFLELHFRANRLNFGCLYLGVFLVVPLSAPEAILDVSNLRSVTG